MNFDEPVYQNSSHLFVNIFLHLHVAKSACIKILSVHHVLAAINCKLGYTLRVLEVFTVDLCQTLYVILLVDSPEVVQDLLFASTYLIIFLRGTHHGFIFLILICCHLHSGHPAGDLRGVLLYHHVLFILLFAKRGSGVLAQGRVHNIYS